MNILITGGCGFIGANLVKFLAGKNYPIKVLDNLSAGNKKYLDDMRLSSFPELIIGDITDKNAVTEAVTGTEAVIHLAAHASVEESLQNPREMWEVNVNGTLNLLEACRQNEVTRFIFASSSAVQGDPALFDQSKILQPLSPYGASKLAGEALCSAYYYSYGVKTIALRFANAYGPCSEHKPSVTTRFIQWARENKPLIIYGDGNQARDFVHASDICQAIYLSLVALDSEVPVHESFGGVLQIASGEETTINHLVQLIMKLAGKELAIVHQPERKGEIKRDHPDITNARTLLGFEPKIKLEKGLRDLWEQSQAPTRDKVRGKT